ncbi:hypothetical protein R1sor_024786 [Riccia sorocarpa]|uniref:EF-hand domain-containing protein n=1 Tax=Riccia sorocarpa TaxID=122646 RepID=A0ABD3GUM6_9MARC
MSAVQTQVLLEEQSLLFEATRLLDSSTGEATVSSSEEVVSRGGNFGEMTDTQLVSEDPEFRCSTTLTLDAVEMRRVFHRFDENNDGLICSQDLFRFMTRLGFEMSEEEAVSMLATVDSNRDGCVDFEEFFSLYRSLCDEERKNSDVETLTEDDDETLLEAFRIFDKNADGFITAEELQIVLLDLGLPEGKSLKNCKRMIQSVDVDGNGEIDIKEFKEMMMNTKFIRCEGRLADDAVLFYVPSRLSLSSLRVWENLTIK